MKDFFRQCRMVKKGEHSVTTYLAWIPEKFAVIDSVLKLKFEDEWQDGWIVRTVGNTRIQKDSLPDSHQAIKCHRRSTGDSLPKRV